MVTERLKNHESVCKTNAPQIFANTHQLRVRSRVFRKCNYPDQIARLKSKVAPHPLIKEAYDSGFEFNDVPMYDAAQLHIRDSKGDPIPIPFTKRALKHNDLVSLLIKLIPSDYSEQRKGCGLAVSLQGIIFFRHSAGVAVDAPLRQLPVFAFDSGAAQGFETEPASSSALPPPEEQEYEDQDPEDGGY